MDASEKDADLEPEQMPYGKVMGVVESSQQLQSMSQAMLKIGAKDVEVLQGPKGVQILEPVCERFYGDIEARMMHRYLETVKNGGTVFAAVVDPNIAEQAAKLAKTAGATQIAHFGNWIVTNY